MYSPGPGVSVARGSVRRTHMPFALRASRRNSIALSPSSLLHDAGEKRGERGDAIATTMTHSLFQELISWLHLQSAPSMVAMC